jgi:hypothetical protein
MAWHLNPALTAFRQAVNAAYPARDKTSDGTIGDAAHQARTSDHNPDPDGSVDAWDMDTDLTGPDGYYDLDSQAIEWLKGVFQAHESSSYWIHEGQIASRGQGWRRRDYDGDNPHNHHVHWNTRESHERSTAPWKVDLDMTRDEMLDLLKSVEAQSLIRAAVINGVHGAFKLGAAATGNPNAGDSTPTGRQIRDYARATVWPGDPGMVTLTNDAFATLLAAVREIVAQGAGHIAGEEFADRVVAQLEEWFRRP